MNWNHETETDFWNHLLYNKNKSETMTLNKEIETSVGTTQKIGTNHFYQRSVTRNCHEKQVIRKNVFDTLKEKQRHRRDGHMSRDVRKPDFCICENKDADQLRGDREADQRLYFRQLDRTIPLLSKSEISIL